jgi:uroporphyrinogen-III synthase
MPDEPPILLMTRPREASERFVAGLDLRGADVCISPLLKIVDTGERPETRPDVRLIFTSSNGVKAFSRSGAGASGRCYCVGDSTAEVARSLLGIDAVSAGGAADDLVRLVVSASTAGDRFLHIRGEHSLGDIAKRLTALNRPTGEVVLYRQDASPLSNGASKALRSGQRVIVPLFSPRTAMLFSAGCPNNARVLGVFMSESVENSVDRSKFESTVRVPSPSAVHMKEAVQRILDTGFA